MNRNWWGGMAKSGFVISRTPSWSKSSKFWEAITSAESRLRTRFRQLRMYSMATGLDSHRYSSSSTATVLPPVSSRSDIYASTLNSRAFRRLLAAVSTPPTPNTRNRSPEIFVCPLKNGASAPTHRECRPSSTSCSSSCVYSAPGLYWASSSCMRSYRSERMG